MLLEALAEKLETSSPVPPVHSAHDRCPVVSKSPLVLGGSESRFSSSFH